jgi:hypothetical protein
LKDELFVYSYDIKDEMIIQAMILNKWWTNITTKWLCIIVLSINLMDNVYSGSSYWWD